MKRAFCVLLSLLLLAGCSATAEGAAILNPNGYDLLKVTDVFISGDSELDEDGNYLQQPEALVIQGSFGTILYPPADVERAYENDGMELVGFAPEDTVCLSLAANCEIWMPKDLLNAVENAKIDDLQAWYDAAKVQMADYLAPDEGSYSFYAQFEMDGDGDLTKIEYCYFDWN